MLNCAAVVQGALHTLNSPLALADTGLQGDLLLSVQHEDSYRAYIGYILVIF